MKCSKCGFENDSDALFCENCGSSLSCKKAKKDRNWRVFNNRKIKMAIKAIILICTPFLGWCLIMCFLKLSYDIKYPFWLGHNLYYVVERNHKQGVIYRGIFDWEIIPVKYDSIKTGWSYDEHLYVKFNDKWGLMSEAGDILIQFKYEELDIADEYNLILAKYDGKYGCIDYQDSIVIPFIYDKMDRHYNRELIRVKKNDKCGVIDRNNRIVLPIVYEDVYPIRYTNEKFRVQQGGKWGIVDNKNNIIIPFKYHLISEQGDSLLYFH